MSNIEFCQLPYEYQRGEISKENAKNFNCHLIKYKRLLNGVESAILEAYFFNESHFKGVLKFWNDQGLRMAKTPNPIDNKFYHWSYEPIT